jgi:hypothetical protein
MYVEVEVHTGVSHFSDGPSNISFQEELEVSRLQLPLKDVYILLLSSKKTMPTTKEHEVADKVRVPG